MKNKYLFMNVASNLTSVIVTLCISIFLSKYLVQSIGSEANGFVSLANTMVNYATIISVALNSVSGRYISISYYNGNKEDALFYFNSTFFANLLLSILMFIIGIWCFFYIDCLLNIPLYLEIDVKKLFLFMFSNYSLVLLYSTFSVSMFITNKLYITSIFSMFLNILKGIIFILLFSIFGPKVYFVGVVMLFLSAITLVFYFLQKRRLTSDLIINKQYFSIKMIFLMCKSGLWSSLSNLSTTLCEGLDLLICNIFISSLSMGYLSLAKTISSALTTIVSNISSVFAPNLTYFYAKGMISELIDELKSNIVLLSCLANIPFCFIVVFGRDVINIWVGADYADIVYPLVILTTISFFNSPAISGFYNIFLITNNLKINAIFWFLISILNMIIVFTLLKLTSLGVYAVAGVSGVVGLIANYTFMPLFSSWCLKVKYSTFYPLILKYSFSTIFVSIILFFIKWYFNFSMNIVVLCFFFFLTTAIALVSNIYIMCNQKEKKSIKNYIRRKK